MTASVTVPGLEAGSCAEVFGGEAVEAAAAGGRRGADRHPQTARGAGLPWLTQRRAASIPHVRWNFTLNVLDGAFFSFGLSFASAATVLPVFVQRLGGSDVAVGLIPVVWALGLNLPQLLIANHAQQVRSKKGLLLATALVQRLPWLLLAVGTFLIVGGGEPRRPASRCSSRRSRSPPSAGASTCPSGSTSWRR